MTGMSDSAQAPRTAGDFDIEEPRRMETARRLLQDARGEAVDRLAGLTARLTGSPYAQVSILTDRQVVAGLHGLELPERDGPLEASLCTVAAAGEGPLVVTDARADERVVGLPPVHSGLVGSYLGVPVVVGGEIIAVLCVYGPDPRSWTPEDVRLVEDMAATVGAELELGTLVASAVQDTIRLDLGFAAANIGSFDWDIATDELHWDERMLELFGYPSGTVVARLHSFTDRVHPDDRLRVDAAIAAAVAACGDYGTEYRIKLPDGSIRWMASRGRVLCGPSGRPERLLGAAFDTTAVRGSEERVARVLESVTSAFYGLDREWRFTHLNSQAERVLGRGRDELLGRVIWDEFPEAVDTPFFTEYHRAADTGQPVSFEEYYAPLRGWFEIRAWPSTDGVNVFFHDISARVDAERQRKRALERLELLSATGIRLSATLEVGPMLDILQELTLRRFGGWSVVALREDVAAMLTEAEIPRRNAFRVVRVDAYRAVGESLPRERLLDLSAEAEEGWEATLLGGIGRALSAAGAEGLAEPEPLGVPLVSRGQAIGALFVGHPTADADDRRLLEDIATRAAVALDNAVLYGAERRAGVALQDLLVPAQLPAFTSVEAAVRYLPGTEGRQVGGDFYIGHELDDGRLVMAIGDVMGHGMQAAARMGQLRAVLTAYAFDGDPPEVILGRVAARADDLLDVRMATVLVLVYDPAARRLTAASAGHPPPLLAPLEGPPRFLPVEPGPPVGSGAARYPSLTVEVPHGSTIVLYTDGLIENRGESITTGLDRLKDSLSDVRLPPDAVCDHVLGRMDRTEGTSDDVALLVFSHL